jgi:hypothetical protein
MHLGSFLLGVFAGATIGVFIMAIFQSGKHDELAFRRGLDADNATLVPEHPMEANLHDFPKRSNR